MSKYPHSAAFRLGPAFSRAIMLAGFALGAIQAASITVNTFNMTPNHDASCGLSEAIRAVNGGAQMWGCPGGDGNGDAIFLPAGTYTTTAELVVTKSVAIYCKGPGACNIDVGNSGEAVFRISGNNDPVFSIRNLTLRQPDGNSNHVTGVIAETGALYLTNVVVTGFEFEGVSIRGEVDGKMEGSTISDNSSSGVSMQSGSQFDIFSSTVTGNGYGILIGGGKVVSQANAISNNWLGVYAVDGIFNDYGSVISNSVDAGISLGYGVQSYLDSTTVRANRNRGIYMAPSSQAIIKYCTIEGNTTSSRGGGLYILAAPGNDPTPPAIAEIFSSTISNNKAGENGGGVYASGTLSLESVTISNDTAARGGGIYHNPGGSGGTAYLHLHQSTVAFNRATIEGGGAFIESESSPFRSRGSIVAQNSAPSKPDVSGFINSVETLYGDVTGFTGTHSSDFFPYNPLLGPLMDNAGPNRVKTHALLKGSPAIDKVTITSAFDEDARGLPRPASGAWDAGAYEAGPFETELLTVIGLSSDQHEIKSESGLSNQGGTVLWANAVGDYVTYAVAIPEPGTYDIALRVKAGSNRGTVEVATAPGTTSFTSIGSVDLYRSSLAYVTRTVGPFTFTSAGIKHFRLRVTGKNANSSGYLCYYDYIKITKQ